MRTIRVALGLLFCAIAAGQLRLSLETVHVATYLDWYVPFLPDPFTNRIDSHRRSNWEARTEYSQSPLIRRRDELLAVNGRSFQGMSSYLQELHRYTQQPEPVPPHYSYEHFVITIRSRDQRIRQVEFNFPHCTCSVPGQLDAVSNWVVAPMLCILAGFTAVWLRPKAMLAWAFLGATLWLSRGVISQMIGTPVFK